MKKLALSLLFAVAGMLIANAVKANFEVDDFGKYSAVSEPKKANVLTYNFFGDVTTTNGHFSADATPLYFAQFCALATIHLFSERWDTIAISDIVTAGTTMNAAVLDGATIVVGGGGSGNYKFTPVADTSAFVGGYTHLKLADGTVLEIGEVGGFPITSP